jgi:heme exporter protein CcmD
VTHLGFIIAAFSVTGAAILITLGWIMLEHRRLRRALSAFPTREGDEA